jgi:hypothetical protein
MAPECPVDKQRTEKPLAKAAFFNHIFHCGYKPAIKHISIVVFFLVLNLLSIKDLFIADYQSDTRIQMGYNYKLDLYSNVCQGFFVSANKLKSFHSNE